MSKKKCVNDNEILAIIFGSITVLLSIGLFYFTKSNQDESEKRHKQYKEDCVKLDAKYGNHYQTKEGPFTGVVFYAVGFGDEAVTVKVYNSVIDFEPRTFRCADLVEVQESK